jgi:hypothetical protein
VCVGEAQTAIRQGIDVRRIDQTTLATVAVDIPDTEIVGENKDNAGRPLGYRSDADEQAKER